MTFHMTIYNGFNLGLERRVNNPLWVNFGYGYEIMFHTGFTANIGFIRINIGDFLDGDEYIAQFEE